MRNLNIRNNSSTDVLGKEIAKDMYRPLSKSEERDMILANKDNPGRIRELLVQHNIRYVFNMAKKYAPTSMDFDDLIARGIYGLCVASEKFDLKRNIKFITYASPWIFKYIVNEYFNKDNICSKTGISLSKSVSDEVNGKMSFMNIVNNYVHPDYRLPSSTLSVGDQLDKKEIHTIYSDIMNYVKTDPNFDSIDKTIFQRNMIDKDSLNTISNDLNLQYAQTSKRKKEILSKIRSYLGEKWGITSIGDLS